MKEEKKKRDKEKNIEMHLRDSSEFQNWKNVQIEEENFKKIE